MKNYLVTGLMIILPLVITLLILGFMVNILTKPFLGFVETALHHLQLFDSISHTFITFFSKILILSFLFGLTYLMGLLGSWFFLNYLINFFDRLFVRIPVVNSIYKSTKDVVGTLFNHEKSTFSKVVLVPFPHENCLSIGLIAQNELSNEELVSVLLPGTPNPMMGFMLMYKADQIIYTNLTVEQALKMIVSCGILYNKSSSDGFVSTLG